MYTFQNTLYVMPPNSYAHLDNATVRIDVDREKRLQVPLHHIGSLVCFGNVLVSPALMHRLADEARASFYWRRRVASKPAWKAPFPETSCFAKRNIGGPPTQHFLWK